MKTNHTKHFHIGAGRKEEEEILSVPSTSICFNLEHVNHLFFSQWANNQFMQEHYVCPFSTWSSNSSIKLDKPLNFCKTEVRNGFRKVNHVISYWMLLVLTFLWTVLKHLSGQALAWKTTAKNIRQVKVKIFWGILAGLPFSWDVI